MIRPTVAVLFFVAAIGCGGRERAVVSVFAASSLTDALMEIGKRYETESGEELSFNFAASNVLARQIAGGAPADLFVSADEAQMQRLVANGLVESRVSLLSNRLAIVVPADSRLTLSGPSDLAGETIRTIALGDPEAVPVGVYAREYLRAAGVWEKVQRKMIPVENARAALAAVTAGNVDAAIVYSTDARTSDSVRIAFEAPGDAIRISYPAAVLRGAKEKEKAGEFLRFLQSDTAKAIFQRYGFVVR